MENKTIFYAYGIQPVLSHIKACNCVFLLTHNSADEQAQM